MPDYDNFTMKTDHYSSGEEFKRSTGNSSKIGYVRRGVYVEKRQE